MEGKVRAHVLSLNQQVWSATRPRVCRAPTRQRRSYDDLGQLTSESRTGYSASYTYDANGNRATKVLGGVTDTYAYDDGDKLTSVTWSGGSKTYGYDSAGRTTSVVSGAGTTTLSYDYESRITGITYPGSSTNSFTYNGLDTRVGKVDSAGTSTYKRDGAYVTDPVLADGSAAFTPTVSERRSSTTTYFHSGLKNNDRQSNTSQTVTATKQYDAFGMLVSSTGTWKGLFSYGGPFGYQEDGDSGLKLLGHRYYDASTGRFLTRDKIKDGRNWYVYCGGDPLKRADSSGNSWLSDLIVDIYEKWSGTDVIGPGGEPVRVGGWPSIFNRKGNAMTVNGTVHLEDAEDYEDYVNDEGWSRHERMHIVQEDEYHNGNAISFVGEIVRQYILAGSHDGAPYEAEGDGATADRTVPEPTGVYKWLQ